MPEEQLKLVIWDLDETLWQGTLAEDGHVTLPERSIHIIKELTSRGIVNSICSKNHFDDARSVLEKAHIWELFVFPHIAFTPKGEAIRDIIANMQLRAPNVLFVDDNHSNLEEARFYNPGIMTLGAGEMDRLLSLTEASGKPDPEHKRLSQYKMLAERHNVRKSAEDNEEFLRNSDINISIVPTTADDVDRIHDMIMRTNQLNFTKKRLALDEVGKLLDDPSAVSATVRVYDRFGDHGVVGWYYLRKGKLEHFLFSCRIINLGIEQYVYTMLGCPQLTVIGDVASSVSADTVMPDWITRNDKNLPDHKALRHSGEELDKLQIYALGACDLYYMVGHMALPLTEVHFECNTFNGSTRGVNVATEYIRSCFEMNLHEKAFCRAHFHNYTGHTAFDTNIFAVENDYVCLSFHDDFALEIYQSREFPDMRVVLSSSKSGSFTPILNPDNVDSFDEQRWLSEHFEPRGLISPERFRENLEWIMERLPTKTHMILMTGPEFDYYRDSEPHNHEFRGQVMRLNEVIRSFCASSSRAVLVEMNDVIYERSHFTNYIMHLKPERSYALAMIMLKGMADNPSNKNLKTQLLCGSRSIVLWGGANSLLPNWLALTAFHSKPDYVITESANVLGAGVQVLEHASLYGASAKYFVLLAPGGDVEYQRAAMDFYGFTPEEDYFVLTQPSFSLEWQENES